MTLRPSRNRSVPEHPPTPTTVYIYLTDGGEFRFRHITGFKVSGCTITRPALKAGAVRFTHSAAEIHSVEYMGDAPTENVRIGSLVPESGARPQVCPHLTWASSRRTQ